MPIVVNLRCWCQSHSTGGIFCGFFPFAIPGGYEQMNNLQGWKYHEVAIWELRYVAKLEWFCPWNKELQLKSGRQQGLGTYYTGWWFGTFFSFPFHIWGHHPNWRSHIFQRGRSTTNGMDSQGFHLWLVCPTSQHAQAVHYHYQPWQVNGFCWETTWQNLIPNGFFWGPMNKMLGPMELLQEDGRCFGGKSSWNPGIQCWEFWAPAPDVQTKTYFCQSRSLQP